MRVRRRLLLLIGLSLAASALLDLLGNQIARSTLRDMALDRLEKETALLASVIEPLLGGIEPSSAEPRGPAAVSPDDLADRFGGDLHLRVTIVSAQGTVVGDSDVPSSDLASVENHLGRPEIQEALSSGTGRARRLSTTVGQEMSYLARRVDSGLRTIGFIRLAVPTRVLEEGGGRLRASIAGMSLVAFGIFSVVSYIVTRRLSTPIERIAAAADVVASGRSDEPIAAEGGGAEMEALAGSLNRMRRSLLDEVRSVQEEKRLLDTVLSGMREALLAVDASRRVILANTSLRRDLGLSPAGIEGRPLAEIIRDPEVGEAFARTLTERVESRVAVSVRYPVDRSFELLVAPLDSPDGEPLGAIGLFLDVTRLHALERMRREFIADVSHELRTPLASLLAALDNLSGPAVGEEADREQFLGIMRRNAERMEALIDDLTDLSLIETGAITLDPEPIDVQGIVEDVVAALEGKAARKRVRIRSEVPDGIVLRGDRRRLDQVLVNIVDNAVKFNDEDGEVTIRAENAGGGAVLYVEDTGPGVPPSDIEKIFQRFYRRDRGRSREAGGTGLGLAIVKHIMRLHGGSVRAELREGGGTRIVLTFPALGIDLAIRQVAGQIGRG